MNKDQEMIRILTESSEDVGIPGQPATGTASNTSKRAKIIPGQVFGRLTAIRLIGPDPDGRGDIWEFCCSCDGRIVPFSVDSVLRNGRRSCGCLGRENAVHKGRARKLPIGEAFLRHIDLENRPLPTLCEGFGPCLLWTGCGDSDGRAQMRVEGKTRRASRVAWFLAYGEWLTTEIHLCHVCDNRMCVNPFHLIPGDAALNGHDRAAKNRGGRLLACHPLDLSSDEKTEELLQEFLQFLQSNSRVWQESRGFIAVSPTPDGEEIRN